MNSQAKLFRALKLAEFYNDETGEVVELRKSVDLAVYLDTVEAEYWIKAPDLGLPFVSAPSFPVLEAELTKQVFYVIKAFADESDSNMDDGALRIAKAWRKLVVNRWPSPARSSSVLV